MAADAEPVYPRLDFERPDKQWLSLNGPWDFAFDDEDTGRRDQWHVHGLPQAGKRTIEVPFVFQTPASGVNDQGAHEVIWYQRKLDKLPEWARSSQKDRSVLLRFGAVDYEAAVWVNGQLVGTHRGGHVPFDVDVTATAADAGMEVTVRVRDSPSDLTQPRGKQYWKPQPESIYYTPSSGIWQSVWLESAPTARIADGSGGTVLRATDIEGGVLEATVALANRAAGAAYSVAVEASFAGMLVATSERGAVPLDKNHASLKLSLRLDSTQMRALPASVLEACPSSDPRCWCDGAALWSPEHPSLYDLTLSLYAGDALVDRVHTATGLRSLSWAGGDGGFRLNGRPYFHALVLDQGYWPRTNMTPPDSGALRRDIELAQAMGFNGCRKHQKVEDPLFMYWANRLGFMVWGEMASAFEFGGELAARFDQEWADMVRRDINHPCVVAWTPANESWGYPDLDHSAAQRNHLRAIYYATKTIDPTRPVNDNCGWQHVLTDLTTFHEYADGPVLEDMCATPESIVRGLGGPPLFVPPTADDPGAEHKPGAPILCTEFGGVNIKPADSGAQKGGEWGYTTASDPEDLLRRFERLCLAVVKGGACCGFVYTQLTDIEQEVNGLYTFDRRPKLEPAKVKEIVHRARMTYYRSLTEGTRM